MSRTTAAGRKGQKEREDKSGRTLQRESAAVKAGDEQGEEEEEEGRRFQQVSEDEQED